MNQEVRTAVAELDFLLLTDIQNEAILWGLINILTDYITELEDRLKEANESPEEERNI